MQVTNRLHDSRNLPAHLWIRGNNTRYDTRLALCDELCGVLPTPDLNATDDIFTRRIAPYFLPELYDRQVPDEVLAHRIENAQRYMGRLVREGVLTGRAVSCALTAAGLPPLLERQRSTRPQYRVRAQTLFALAGTAVSAYA